MNYPTQFQTPFALQSMYSSLLNSLPQQADLLPAGLLQELWADNDEEFRAPEPMKKIKGSSYNTEIIPAGNSQTGYTTSLAKNDLIKSKNFPSNFNAASINDFNYFDQRLSANHQPSTNLGIGLMNIPQKGFLPNPPENGSTSLFYPGAMPNFQNNPQLMAQQMAYMAMVREQAMMRSAQLSSSSQAFPPGLQMSLLQNLQMQQQRANNQKNEEQQQQQQQQLLLNHFNNLAKSSMSSHFQNVNAAQFLQAKQNMMQQQEAQNRLMFQKEAAQRVYEDFVKKQQQQQQQNQKVPEASQPKNDIFDEFADLPLDQLLPPEYYGFMDGTFGEGFTVEEFNKTKGMDDLDDKKTAETSASNPDDVVFGGFVDGLPDTTDMMDIHGDFLEESSWKKGTPKKEESLLKKRRLDVIEREEKYQPNKQQVFTKPINPKLGNNNTGKGKRTKVQTPEESTTSMFQDFSTNPSSTFFSSEVPTKTSPQAKAKKEKAKTAKDVFVPMEMYPVRKERKMNRLQSQRQAWDNYFEEQKKPYVIQLHVAENVVGDQKVVNTRRGDGFQASIVQLEGEDTMRPRRTRAVKSLWDPSALNDEKIREFERAVSQIYGQEIKNQEAALKILRGTGMNVESTVENIANNKMYFKGILFPEPKPAAKAQRNL